MRCDIVRQLVSSPPSQRWLTYGMPARFACSETASWPASSCRRTARCRRGRDVAGELVGLLEQALRLLQIDDVDAAALREDEAAHLRVPAARLVAEVDAGLQELPHRDDGHRQSSLRFRLSQRRRGAGAPARAGTATRPISAGTREWNRRSLAGPPALYSDQRWPRTGVRRSPKKGSRGWLRRSATRPGSWPSGSSTRGMREDALPSLTRIDELDRLGDIPSFIGELGSHVVDPEPGRIRPGGPARGGGAQSCARPRGAGFAPREVVLELLLLRRVVWRFLSGHQSLLGETDMLVAERRLDDLIDTLVVECAVAYFERATAELSYRARRDALTGLLNHHAFWTDLDRELERAGRYGHGLTFVVVDLDHFKSVNDTRGHPVGDRVLRCVADALGAIARSSDLVARVGGDEFAVALVETTRPRARRSSSACARRSRSGAPQTTCPATAASARGRALPDRRGHGGSALRARGLAALRPQARPRLDRLDHRKSPDRRDVG